MMTPAQSFARIARLMERAAEKGAHPNDVRSCVIQAHTHAVLQGLFLQRAEARVEAAKHVAAGGALQ